MPTRSITAHDNFERMMRHQGAHWLPLDMPMTPPVVREMIKRTGCDNASDAFDLDFHYVDKGWEQDIETWKQALTQLGFVLPENAIVRGYGITHAVPPKESLGSADHLLEMLHPLSTVTEVGQLEQLPWPNLKDPTLGANLPIQIAAGRKLGRVITASMQCTVFEHAWFLRGMDNLFMDIAEGTGIADWLLDWFTKRSVALATCLARAGVDVIGLGDDVGTQIGMMMSPDYWRLHFKPRLARVVHAIRDNQGDKHIWIRYHSDGDIRDILDDLHEIGIDILNPLQPECMPVTQTVRQYQHKLGFWGAIGTQTTMPFGTTEDVRKAVDDLAELVRQGAAIVVAPTHVLEPDVPWANIEALVSAVRQVSLIPAQV